MWIRAHSLNLLDQEARALLTRLNGVKPFALNETMVPAAAPSLVAQTAVESHLKKGRDALRGMVARYRQWLGSPEAGHAPVAEAQRRLTFLRLRFNAVLSQYDIFSDVTTQRSENETGVWLAGLDVVASDALALPGNYYRLPPLVVYLDRQHGGAIRRARTRLPGGGQNPVAVIRIPRERMVGSGIASSLVHEVGHQGVALLDLVNSVRELLESRKRSGDSRAVWQLYARWLSESLADFWAVARVGITATMGLMGVVSLPRTFVFRLDMEDPHPVPWLRVKLSCAVGEALYPDPQWRRVAAIWESYYPLTGLGSPKKRLLVALEASLPAFVELLVNHRPGLLRGQTLGQALASADRQPGRLRAYYEAWRASAESMRAAAPSLAFAVIGQARADDKLTPEAESRWLGGLLTYWALRRTLNASAICAAQEQPRGLALAT